MRKQIGSDGALANDLVASGKDAHITMPAGSAGVLKAIERSDFMEIWNDPTIVMQGALPLLPVKIRYYWCSEPELWHCDDVIER
jgi:hypothetical protein